MTGGGGARNVHGAEHGHPRGEPHRPGRRRLRGCLGTGAVLVAAAALMLGHAARLRADPDHAAARRALVETLGTADLALSSSSRWLRHPSLAEPGAPFADGPATLDTDPAGGLIGPPRAILMQGAAPVPRKVGP